MLRHIRFSLVKQQRLVNQNVYYRKKRKQSTNLNLMLSGSEDQIPSTVSIDALPCLGLHLSQSPKYGEAQRLELPLRSRVCEGPPTFSPRKA